MRRIVDLPHPDGPSRARNEPLSVCRSVSCSASSDLPPRSAKDLDTPEIWMPVPVWAPASVSVAIVMIP